MNKSMFWYELFYCIKLPISITISVIIYGYLSFKYDLQLNTNIEVFNTPAFIIWLSLILTSILYTILLYKMYYRDKDTYFYFIVCLIIDVLLILPLQMPLYLIIKNNTLSTFTILCFSIIWFITNNSYMGKRKYIFTEDK